MTDYLLMVLSGLFAIGISIAGMWAYRYWLGPKPQAPDPGVHVFGHPASETWSFVGDGGFPLPSQVSTTQRFKERGKCDVCGQPVKYRCHDGASLCSVHKVQRV